MFRGSLRHFFGQLNQKLPVLPAVLCMLIFIMHPMGANAAIYSLFWLIPFIQHFIAKILFLLVQLEVPLLLMQLAL